MVPVAHIETSKWRLVEEHERYCQDQNGRSIASSELDQRSWLYSINELQETLHQEGTSSRLSSLLKGHDRKPWTSMRPV